ncbi:MAG: helix-turn-helix domain-containing protein [Gemmiger sp.]
MKHDLLSIGKMAEMNHTTVATLRLYDRLGLLHPRYTDKETGYRYYDIQQNARLDMIAYMKELGMSLGEIGEVLAQEDITRIEEILIRKNEQIHQQIRELKTQHDAVERAIGCIERYRRSPHTGTVALEFIDRRYIWSISCVENFYEKGIRSYEQTLLTLREALTAQGLSHVHSYNTGTSIALEDFQNGCFVPDKVFIFTDHRAAATLPGSAIVDSGMYACIYLDSYDDEIDGIQHLMEFCAEQHYTPCGDYLCEVLTEFNIFDSEQRSMFLRLQVPVSFYNEKG